jgi:CRP/FNR family transcriptional regulator
MWLPVQDGLMITLYHIDPGQSCVLSSGCILNHRPFPAQATCLTDVEAFLVPAARVQQWTRDNELWRSFMFETLSSRLSHLIELVDSLVFKTVPERLWDWLLANAVPQTLNDATDLSAQPPRGVVTRTHQQIADELGTSREVVSRALKQLEKAGRVRLHRGQVVVTSNHS